MLLRAFQLLICAAAIARSATVEWTYNPLAEIAGFRVYVGESSGSYSRSVDVGNVFAWVVDKAPLGGTNYYAVTAYDADGLESDFSDELSWMRKQSQLSIKTDSTDNVIEIWSTTDFVTWSHRLDIQPTQFVQAEFFSARGVTVGISRTAGSKVGKLQFTGTQ